MADSTPKIPVDSRVGFIDERFEKQPPKNTYGAFGSILSILSLVFMTSSAFYMVRQLDDTYTAFHRVNTKKVPLFQAPVSPRADTFGQFFDEVPCFFPGIAYNETYSHEYGECNTKPVCNDKKSKCDRKAPLWARLPFYFTIWGAGLGAVFELVLLLIFKPFQQSLNPFTQWVSRLRLLNLAFVAGSVFFFSVCMTVPFYNVVNLRFLMYLSTAGASALAPALFSGGFTSGGYDFIPPTLLGIQLVQFVFVVSRGVVSGGSLATFALASAPVLQSAALLMTTATPVKSTGFHVLSTLGGLSLYVALMLAGNESPSFPFYVDVALRWPESTSTGFFLAAAAALGWTATMNLDPKVYQNFRSEMSYYVWSLLYYVLLGAPSQPLPYRISAIFADEVPQRITLVPYSQEHRYDVSPNLGVPAIADGLPQTVEANAGSLVQKVVGLFKIISRLDYFFPQADVDAPLEHKPRMAVTDDAQDAYPSGLFNIGLMKDFPNMGKNLQRAPQPAVDAFKDGEILSWLCQYGIGNTFLKKAVETEEYPFYKLVDPACEEKTTEDEKTGLVMDFTNLEVYEYKDDYEPYGGVAFFHVNAEKNLKVSWLVAPMTKSKVLPKIKNQAYRRAEAMISSSLYFSVIAGKHLAEIHMTYNLLEVAAHNSFDVALNEFGIGGDEAFNAHPLRLYLYIHLFSHGLAEEETTEHLVQKGAVFSQIFAIKYESLCDYLSEKYNSFEYASDEDFEYRKEIMKPLVKKDISPYHEPPFSTGLDWELEYFKIFENYAKGMAEAMYGEDEAKADENVKSDDALQGFYKTLECYFNKMPSRYDGFQTLKGVTRFMADSTYHLVVRHQFYGTTAVACAMDPRIGYTQVPKDGGTIGVDEWRSLAFIGLATAYANFVHLIEDPDEHSETLQGRPLEDIFEDATPQIPGGMKAKLVKRMQGAWWQMQGQLKDLNDDWEKSDSYYKYHQEGVSPSNWKTDINYMYCRPLPKDCHTGPGY